MATYTVTAERSGHWWALQCLEVPGALSQVAHIAQADQIKEAIAFVAGVKEGDIDIDLKIVVPGVAKSHLERARVLTDHAAAEAAEAAQESRAAVSAMRNAGLTLSDIGAIMGISFQRVHQLTRS